MTDWEVGQDLIAAQDAIFDRMSREMKETHPAAYWVLRESALLIGDYFNQHHMGKESSHGFGLACHSAPGPKHSEEPKPRETAKEK